MLEKLTNSAPDGGDTNFADPVADTTFPVLHIN